MAEEIKDEIVLNDDELICVLTGNKKKANAKELMLQSVYLQPIITQYFIDNKSEIWLLFLIAHSKR